MPLFALEQIVLLSFAVREWGRGRPPPRERQKRARALRRQDEREAARRSRPFLCLCFFRSVLPLLVMRARSLQLYSNTNNRRWHYGAYDHVKTRRTADAVIAIPVVIARLRQAIRNLYCDDSRVKNKIYSSTVIPRYKNISLHACHYDCK